MLTEKQERIAAYIRRNGVKTDCGQALRRGDARGYLLLHGFGAESTDYGLQITRFGQVVANLAPIFANGEGWLYRVDELDAAMQSERKQITHAQKVEAAP